jgi:hypothetical protein
MRDGRERSDRRLSVSIYIHTACALYGRGDDTGRTREARTKGCSKELLDTHDGAMHSVILGAGLSLDSLPFDASAAMARTEEV